MSSASLHPYDSHDPDFEAPLAKGPVPTSRLAVLSLVMGILGFFIPVFGSLVAVVAGHVAIGEINRSRGALEGRALAKVGLILGYSWIVLGLLVLAFISTFTFRYAGPIAREIAGSHVTHRDSSPSWDAFSRPGVKLANELTPSYAAWLKSSGLIGDDEPIVVAYEAENGPAEGPEFAVVTTEKVHYIKKGHVTTIDLKDVTDVASGESFHDRFGGKPIPGGPYPVGISTATGPSMRIQIDSESEGQLFVNRLEEAWRNCREGAEPEPAKATSPAELPVPPPVDSH